MSPSCSTSAGWAAVRTASTNVVAGASRTNTVRSAALSEPRAAGTGMAVATSGVRAGPRPGTESP